MPQPTPRGFHEPRDGVVLWRPLPKARPKARPPPPPAEGAREPGPEPEPSPPPPPSAVFCRAGCGMFANVNAGFETCCGACPRWHTAECGQRQAESFWECWWGLSWPWRNFSRSVPPHFAHRTAALASVSTPPPPAASTEAVFPRHAPRDAALLPPAILCLADQLPPMPGRLAPASRILRAVQMGASDRAVARGDPAAERAPCQYGPRGLVARVYVVLVDQYGQGPWICGNGGDYEAAVGRPCAPAAVSGIFASDAEAIAYLWGSGVDAVLPPIWVGAHVSRIVSR